MTKFTSIFFLKIYFRLSVSRRGTGRERISSRLPTVSAAGYRAPSHDPEIRTLAETKSQTLNRPRHRGIQKFASILRNLNKMAIVDYFNVIKYVHFNLKSGLILTGKHKKHPTEVRNKRKIHYCLIV